MRLLDHIIRELLHRPVNSLLGVLGVFVAVIAWVAAVGSMKQFDTDTSAELDKLKEKTDVEMAKLEDDIRRTMKGLGFNVYIFPTNEELWEIKQRGFAEETMPEDYATRLSESRVLTINHILPQLSRRVFWEEENRSILIVGISGQVPLSHRASTKPIMEPLKPGTAFLGHDLHRSLGLKTGDNITVNEKTYAIAKTFPPRNFLDDGSIWIHLAEAQEIFEMPGRINAILALGCNCASMDRLGTIRAELADILPEVQIVEMGSKAMVRAETRIKAGQRAKAARDAVIARRDESRRERERYAKLLSSLVAIGSFAGLVTLAFLNIRERLAEIGTLRALGVKGISLSVIFLGRAAFIGVLGFLLAFLLIPVLTRLPLIAPVATKTWVQLALGIPALSAVAAWLPTLYALVQDPVTILRND